MEKIVEDKIDPKLSQKPWFFWKRNIAPSLKQGTSLAEQVMAQGQGLGGIWCFGSWEPNWSHPKGLWVSVSRPLCAAILCPWDILCSLYNSVWLASCWLHPLVWELSADADAVILNELARRKSSAHVRPPDSSFPIFFIFLPLGPPT